MAILLTAASARAQDTTALEQQAPEVEVVGRHEADPSSTAPSIDAARTRLEQTPGGASVVDSETYKEGRASTLVDALGLTPGVYVQERIPGAGEARLSIRGSGVQRTFHLRGIRLLQDGVPVNQADGAGDFQALEPLAARYIEVYRGANALRYGATTLGGAINYFTYSGYDAAPLQARIETGSFGYLRGQASIAGVKGRTDYYASLSHFSQDGFRDHSRQNDQRLFTSLGLQLSPALETRFWFSYAHSISELPGNLSKAQLYDDPRQANPGNVAGDHHRDFDLYRLANLSVYRFGAQRVEVGLYYVTKDLWHPIFQVLSINSQDYGTTLRFVSEQPLFGHRNLFTAGLNLGYLDQRDDRFQNVGGNPGARTAASNQYAGNVEAYLENQFYVLPQDVLVLGVQAARATRRYVDEFLANGDNSFSIAYDEISPKVGWRHEFTPQVQVFGNYSHSFEPPSFGELAGGPTITQVRAQSADTWEIGSRGALRDYSWDVAFYRARVKDELLSQNSPSGQPLDTVNAPSTLHQGIEVGVGARLWRQFELQGMALWNDFHFRDHPLYGDNQLPGIPEYFLRGQLLYRGAGNFYAGPTLEWSPQRYPVDMANTLFADGYVLVGFKFGQERTHGWSWFVEARNLTDKTYAATTGVIASANATDSAQFLPGQGLSVYAGLEWKSKR